MARESTTQYAILGMLARGPATGYDLRQEIRNGVSHFWSESYGQVYPVLRDLAETGLATVTVERGMGGPDRKIYTITEAGRDQLRAWLRRPAVPSPNRNEMLLKLFFGHHVSDADLAAIVQDYRDRWAEDMEAWKVIAAHVQKDEDSDRRDLRDRLFTLRYGALVGAATVQWADEVLAALRPDQPLPGT